jgi:hypothetical protein
MTRKLLMTAAVVAIALTPRSALELPRPVAEVSGAEVFMAEDFTAAVFTVEVFTGEVFTAATLTAAVFSAGTVDSLRTTMDTEPAT